MPQTPRDGAGKGGVKPRHRKRTAKPARDYQSPRATKWGLSQAGPRTTRTRRGVAPKRPSPKTNANLSDPLSPSEQKTSALRAPWPFPGPRARKSAPAVRLERQVGQAVLENRSKSTGPRASQPPTYLCLRSCSSRPHRASAC